MRGRLFGFIATVCVGYAFNAWIFTGAMALDNKVYAAAAKTVAEQGAKKSQSPFQGKTFSIGPYSGETDMRTSEFPLYEVRPAIIQVMEKRGAKYTPGASSSDLYVSAHLHANSDGEMVAEITISPMGAKNNFVAEGGIRVYAVTEFVAYIVTGVREDDKYPYIRSAKAVAPLIEKIIP